MDTSAPTTNHVNWRALAAVAASFIVFFALLWFVDATRPQSTMTIYTVGCRPGTWEGNHCYGRLVPGPRYRFEVVVARGEVHFSNVEQPGRHGLYSQCVIEDLSNWSCEPNALTPTSIAHKMENGRPVPDPAAQTLPFHEVQEWRWWLLRMGFPVGHGET